MARVTIVGAGLSGSLMAVFLARRGHTVEVFERYPGAEAKRGGRPALNITLCERGLMALEAVGLRESVLDLAVPARGRQVHVPDGSTAYQPYGNRREAIYSISRSDLNQALVDFAGSQRGVQFRFEQKCTHVDLTQARARFEHTRSGSAVDVESDIILGADGAYSTVRSFMQKREHFNYSQQYWPFGGYKSLWLPAGPSGTPALPGEVLHIWPRGSRMLIGFPKPDGSAMLSLLLPLKGPDSFESLSDERSVSAFFRSSFPDIADAIPALAQQFFELPANSLLTVRCSPWSINGKVLLLGDSAHAMLPSYGQGANAAFEDCLALDACMAKHGDAWASVFEAFESARRADLDVMADLCIEHFSEISDLIADPRFLKRRAVERELTELYPELYQSLYSMISFSRIPYAEAFRIERRQRSTVDKILVLEAAGEALDTPAVRSLLEHGAAGPELGNEPSCLDGPPAVLA